jgi:pimeloyl-[acyl-carrier protein] methyl ester esterase
MTALIVLPGLDGTATLHDDFIQAVRSSFESISVVPYPTDKRLSYEQLEALVRASLPKHGPIVLLGESFSGPIAISIAASPPENLVGLILSTTFAQSPVPFSFAVALFANFLPIRAVPFTFLCWWLLGRWATSALKASLRKSLLSVSVDVLRFRVSIALRVNASAKLPSIAIPVLYLRAGSDRLLSDSSGAHIFSTVPHCSIVEIEGPHLLLQASPLKAASAVSTFSSGLTGR